MPQAYQKLGRYLITDEIAQGGMATIYRGKLIGVAGFEKDVAIKKILPFWSHQKEFIDMLIDEAKVLVHLSHANIVHVIELCKEGDNYFIVMEYVPGFDLRKLTRKLGETGEVVPVDVACYMIRQVCLGLEFAHKRTNRKGERLNIIHRDISPQNILVSIEGNVKVTDFGIAKVIGKTSETATGVLKGKFSYMSPEQALGADIDQRTDVFALGALFYEILTGKKCFDGRNDLEIIEAVKNVTVDYPESLPEALVTLLRKALTKRPDDRYQNVTELKRDLERFERSENFSADDVTLKDFLRDAMPDEIEEIDSRETEMSQKTKLFADPTKEATLVTEGSVVATVVDKSSTRDDSNVPKENSYSQKTVLHDLKSYSLTDETVINDKTVLDNPKSSKRVFEETKLTTPPPADAFSKQVDLVKNAANQLLLKKHDERVLWGVFILAAFVTLTWFTSLRISFQAEKFPQARLSAPITIQRQTTPFVKPELTTDKNTYESVKNPANKFFLAKLEVKVTPESATIAIGSGDKTETATGKISKIFELTDKMEIPVTATLDGFRTQTQTLTFDKATLSRQASFTLEKLVYGSVVVRARPWGYATIKGLGSRQTDTTFKVPTGGTVVTVTHPASKKSVSKAVTVRAGATITCQATFSEKTSFMTCQ